MTKMYRQGDILFRKVESLPRKPRKLKTDIIVKGEATGHAHRIEHGTLFMSGAVMFIEADKGATIVHEEHAPIELEPGIYEVVRQREFDPNVNYDQAPYVED